MNPNEPTDFVGHVQEHDEETHLLHWYVTAQSFLMQLDATAAILVERRRRFVAERLPFLRVALMRCFSCTSGLDEALSSSPFGVCGRCNALLFGPIETRHNGHCGTCGEAIYGVPDRCSKCGQLFGERFEPLRPRKEKTNATTKRKRSKPPKRR